MFAYFFVMAIFAVTGLSVYLIHQHPDVLLNYIDAGVTFGIGLWVVAIGSRL